MGDILQVGIIGAGHVGAKRAQAIAQSPGARLVAVADADAARAQAFAEAHACRALADGEALAALPELDAVVVATPHQWLAPLSLAALEAGKHVLCEKPLARTAAEAELLVTASERRGKRLKAGFNHRHHPAILEAHRRAAAGSIGRLLFLRCRYGHGGRLGYEREWRADPAQSGGGELLDQGIHALDLFRWFLGDFTEVSAVLQQAFWPTLVEDNAFCLLRTEAGQVASLHASWTQWKNLFSFEVFGEHGYLIVEGLGGSYGRERLVAGERPAEFGAPAEQCFEYNGGDASWAAEWEEFAAAIREDRPPLADGRDGWQALRLAEAAYASARARRVIHLAQGESHAQRRVHLELSRGRSASGRDD